MLLDVSFDRKKVLVDELGRVPILV